MRGLPLVILLILTLAAGAGCGGNNPNPIQPPPPPDPIQFACPVSITRDATSPEGTDVHFDAPVPAGGRAPYNVQCEPGSSNRFRIGESTVRCTATDAANTQTSCSFTVVVRVRRTLAKSRFLAFGDSITEGQVSPAATFTIVEPLESYPFKLEQTLNSRYPAQQVSVINGGFGGETAARGAARLPGVLAAERPEVLLLQEGTNGLTPATVGGRADSLRAMVMAARQRNVDVVIANLLPVGPPHTDSRLTKPQAVRDLNARIASIAAEFGIAPPLDLYSIFAADPRLIGIDGLHPTRDGYTRIADAFADEIARRYGREMTMGVRLKPDTTYTDRIRPSR